MVINEAFVSRSVLNWNLNDDVTDYRKSFVEGTSLENALKVAKDWITSRKERVKDYCAFVNERRIVSCCCLDAVKDLLTNSYMTKEAFEAWQRNLRRPALLANCKCGERIEIGRAEQNRLLFQIAGESQYAILEPLKFCIRSLNLAKKDDGWKPVARGVHNIMERNIDGERFKMELESIRIL